MEEVPGLKSFIAVVDFWFCVCLFIPTVVLGNPKVVVLPLYAFAVLIMLALEFVMWKHCEEDC